MLEIPQWVFDECLFKSDHPCGNVVSNADQFYVNVLNSILVVVWMSCGSLETITFSWIVALKWSIHNIINSPQAYM